MLPNVQPGFAKRGEPKKNFFFAQKLPDLASEQDKPMQFKRVKDGHSY